MATASVYIYDLHRNPFRIRVLLDTDRKKSSIKRSVLLNSCRPWEVTTDLTCTYFHGPTLHTEVENGLKNFRFIMSMEIIDDGVYQNELVETTETTAAEAAAAAASMALARGDNIKSYCIPNRLRAPIMSRRVYSAYYRYCLENKNSFADSDFFKLRKKWLNVDGVIGYDWFDEYGVSLQNEYDLTGKYKLRDSELGVLFIRLK